MFKENYKENPYAYEKFRNDMHYLTQYHKETEILHAIQELNELSVVLTKYLVISDEIEAVENKIADEIVDCKIMLESLSLIFKHLHPKMIEIFREKAERIHRITEEFREKDEKENECKYYAKFEKMDW